MLDAALLPQLSELFAKLTRPVIIQASVDGTDLSREMETLLEELAQLSSLIRVEPNPAPAARTPAFSLTTPGQDMHLSFAGLPMGHEFSSLVLAVLQVGGHPAKVDPATADAIRALDREMVFETYYSQSCHNCPEVVQALNLMSVLNPRITHVAIDGGAFPDEVRDRGIMAVPSVFLNGSAFASGRMDLDQIMAKLAPETAQHASRALSQKPPFDTLIVGGGPAGAAAAIYAARKGIRTGLLAGRMGGQVQDTMDIENLISVVHTQGPRLAAALDEHVRQYEVDLMPGFSATRIWREGDAVHLEIEGGGRLTARTLILAPGARWRQMGVPGEEQYRNRGVAYCPHCDGPLFKGKRVAVIGGGNSGVEAAIDLAGLASEVVVLEFADKLRADEVLQRKLRSLPNARVVLNAQTTEVLGDGNKVIGLRYQDRSTNHEQALDLDGVFVQIGLLPNTEWLSGAVELTDRGEIVIDDHGRTSLPGVFAAGDATTVPYKQIVSAMGDGARAALAAFDHLIRAS